MKSSPRGKTNTKTGEKPQEQQEEHLQVPPPFPTEERDSAPRQYTSPSRSRGKTGDDNRNINIEIGAAKSPMEKKERVSMGKEEEEEEGYGTLPPPLSSILPAATAAWDREVEEDNIEAEGEHRGGGPGFFSSFSSATTTPLFAAAISRGSGGGTGGATLQAMGEGKNALEAAEGETGMREGVMVAAPPPPPPALPRRTKVIWNRPEKKMETTTMTMQIEAEEGLDTSPFPLSSSSLSPPPPFLTPTSTSSSPSISPLRDSSILFPLSSPSPLYPSPTSRPSLPPGRGVRTSPSLLYPSFAFHGENGKVFWVTYGSRSSFQNHKKRQQRLQEQKEKQRSNGRNDWRCDEEKLEEEKEEEGDNPSHLGSSSSVSSSSSSSSSLPPPPNNTTHNHIIRNSNGKEEEEEEEMKEGGKGWWWYGDSDEEEEDEVRKREEEEAKEGIRAFLEVDVKRLKETLLIKIRREEEEKAIRARARLEEAEKKRNKAEEKRVELDMMSSVEGKHHHNDEKKEKEEWSPRKDEMFVTRFRPRVYRDLLTDDGLNLTLLQWLQSWQEYIFGPPSSSLPPRSSNSSGSSSLPLTGEEEEDGGEMGRGERGENHLSHSPYSTSGGRTTTSTTSAFSSFHPHQPVAKPPEKRLAVLAGPPGCGKTVLVELLAAHCGYELVEVNASADRSVGRLQSILEMASSRHLSSSLPSSSSSSLSSSSSSSFRDDGGRVFSQHPPPPHHQHDSTTVTTPRPGKFSSLLHHLFRPKCVLLDEIDGLTPDVVEYLLKQDIRCPLFCIANDLYAPSLRALRTHCADAIYPVQPLQPQRLLARLQEVVEVLKIEEEKRYRREQHHREEEEEKKRKKEEEEEERKGPSLQKYSHSLGGIITSSSGGKGGRNVEPGEAEKEATEEQKNRARWAEEFPTAGSLLLLSSSSSSSSTTTTTTTPATTTAAGMTNSPATTTMGTFPPPPSSPTPVRHAAHPSPPPPPSFFSSCMTREILSEIVWESDGDIRSCLNSLQFLYLQQQVGSSTTTTSPSKRSLNTRALLDQLQRDRPLPYFSVVASYLTKISRHQAIELLKKEYEISYERLWECGVAALQAQTMHHFAERGGEEKIILREGTPRIITSPTTVATTSSSHFSSASIQKMDCEETGDWRMGIGKKKGEEGGKGRNVGGGGNHFMRQDRRGEEGGSHIISSSTRTTASRWSSRTAVVPGFRMNPGFLYLLQRALAGKLSHLSSLLLDGLFEQYLELQAFALDYTLLFSARVAEAFSFHDDLSSMGYTSGRTSGMGGEESLVGFAERYAVEGTCLTVYAAVVGSGGRSAHSEVGGGGVGGGGSRTGRGISAWKLSKGLRSVLPSAASRDSNTSGSGGVRLPRSGGLHFPQEGYAFHRRFTESLGIIRSLPEEVRVPYWSAYCGGNEVRAGDWCPYLLWCLYPKHLLLDGNRNQRRWGSIGPVITGKNNTHHNSHSPHPLPPTSSSEMWRSKTYPSSFSSSSFSSSFSYPNSLSEEVRRLFEETVKRHTYYGLTYKPPPSQPPFASSSPFSSSTTGGDGVGDREGNRWGVKKARGGGYQPNEDETKGNRKDGEEEEEGGRRRKRDGGGGEEVRVQVGVDFASRITAGGGGGLPITWVLHPPLESVALLSRIRGGSGAGNSGPSHPWLSSSPSSSSFFSSSSAWGREKRGGGGKEYGTPEWSSSVSLSSRCASPLLLLFMVKDDLRQLMVGEIQRWLVIFGRPSAIPPSLCMKNRGGEGLAAEGVGDLTLSSRTSPFLLQTPPPSSSSSTTTTTTHRTTSENHPQEEEHTWPMKEVQREKDADPQEKKGERPCPPPPAPPQKDTRVVSSLNSSTNGIVYKKDFFGRLVPVPTEGNFLKGMMRGGGMGCRTIPQTSAGGIEDGGRKEGSRSTVSSPPSLSPSSSFAPGNGSFMEKEFSWLTAAPGEAGKFVKYVFFDGATNAVKLPAKFVDF